MPFLQYIALFLGVLIGGGAGYSFFKRRRFEERNTIKRAEEMILESGKEAKEILERTRAAVLEQKKQFESDQEEFMRQHEAMEKIFSLKLAQCQKREGKIAEMRSRLEQEERHAQLLKDETHTVKKAMAESLFKAAALSLDRVREELFSRFESEFQRDAEFRLRAAEQYAEESAVRDAKNVLAASMYRYAAATSVEHDSGVLSVPRDEIKGRIVGRGAKNIALFEELFGVDVIFNDEPNTIILSCFNLVQREVARTALQRLMKEKEITEEMIQRVKPLAEQDTEKILRREGEKALNILGLKNMQDDFVKLVGRLRFRTSYGQNIMGHCFEVGYFARLMASEIGADPEIAFLGGFFHDIGKAIDQEVGGSHDVLSKEILEKYGFSWEITHAAWTHHNAIPQETVEARIVQAADAISAGRPGARAESVERYLAKINELQATGLSFGGVKKAFAINAGRELRVVVEPSMVSDAGVSELATQIAAKVQEKGGYPGKIKIMTIRVTKSTDYAR